MEEGLNTDIMLPSVPRISHLCFLLQVRMAALAKECHMFSLGSYVLIDKFCKAEALAWKQRKAHWLVKAGLALLVSLTQSSPLANQKAPEFWLCMVAYVSA